MTTAVRPTPGQLSARDALSAKSSIAQSLAQMSVLMEDIRRQAGAADFCTCGGGPECASALEAAITRMRSQVEHRRAEAEAMALGSTAPPDPCPGIGPRERECLNCARSLPVSEYGKKGVTAVDPICRGCRAEARRLGRPLSAAALREARS